MMVTVQHVSLFSLSSQFKSKTHYSISGFEDLLYAHDQLLHSFWRYCFGARLSQQTLAQLDASPSTLLSFGTGLVSVSNVVGNTWYLVSVCKNWLPGFTGRSERTGSLFGSCPALLYLDKKFRNQKQKPIAWIELVLNHLK